MKSISVVFTALLFAVGANAQSNNPFLGKYKIDSKKCTLSAAESTDRLFVRKGLDQGAINSTIPTLYFDFYAANESGSSIDIMSGTGSRSKLSVSSINESWNTVVTSKSIQYNYSESGKTAGGRNHSYKKVVNVKVTKTGLSISESVNGATATTCEATSLAKVNTELQVLEVAQVKHKTLNALLAKAKELNSLYFDQAEVTAVGMKFSRKKGKIGINEIKEAVRLIPIGTFVVNSKITVTTGMDTQQAATTALKTGLGNLEGSEETAEDFNKLSAFVKKLKLFLDNEKKNFSFSVIEWAESDSDGEGIFIIDPKNDEAIYIGSEYNA